MEGRSPGTSPEDASLIAPLLPPPSTPAEFSGLIDYAQLAMAQRDCTDVQRLLKDSSLHIREFQTEGSSLFCDVSTGLVRPLVPKGCRRSFFKALHSIAHPGIRASRRLVSARFVWPRVAADVASLSRCCQRCARGKVHKYVHAPVETLATPTWRFAHIHVDLVGPLLASKEGHTYLFTVILVTKQSLC
jgi:hypothetical protein